MTNMPRVLMAVALALLPFSAVADPVNYTFQVTATSGPLNGTLASGTFSFDSGTIPVGGGDVSQTGLLTDLDFTWNGIAYTEATANTGFLSFNAAGDLIGFCFGNNTAGGSCSVVFGQEQWFVAHVGFAYSTPGPSEGYTGTVSFELAQNQAPEPGTLALLGLGLAGLAVARRRRKSATIA